MTVKEFIVKYKVHQAMLAGVLGIDAGSFSDKMNGKRYGKFSPEQEKKLAKFIKKMGQHAQLLL